MSKFKLSILSAGLAAALALSVTSAVATSEPTKGTLRIAAIDPFSGSMAGAGMPSLKQMQFDAERINAEGGINGLKVEIVPLDNKLDAKETLVQLQKAVDSGIHYIAHMASDKVASALISGIDKNNERNPDKRVLYLNYGANGTEFTNERCSFWHFLFDANTKMKMAIATDWIASQDKIKKVFVINPDYSYGHEVAKHTREMLKTKRPDIEIVKEVFVPTGKVKDFMPYVTNIVSSGADLIMTGNWGQDMTLLVKAAGDMGLKVPFLTLYANSPGSANAMGESGVNRVYLVSMWTGDLNNEQHKTRQEAFKAASGYDYADVRETAMLDMLKLAMETANSVDPLKVARALEGLKYDGQTGPATMRASDHQLLPPIFVSIFTDNQQYGLDTTNGLNYKTIKKYAPDQAALETKCKMRRPK